MKVRLRRLWTLPFYWVGRAAGAWVKAVRLARAALAVGYQDGSTL